jgi:hypothetical protein
VLVLSLASAGSEDTVVADDMPFLVDSVSMVITDRGRADRDAVTARRSASSFAALGGRTADDFGRQHATSPDPSEHAQIS